MVITRRIHMTRQRALLTVLSVLALLAAAAGCGGGRDCKGYCQEAQAANCTSIKGDCGAFCNALESVSSSGGCQSQKDAYNSCLESGPLCETDSRCSSQSNAAGTCAAKYCLTHATDSNCTVIKAALGW
jgi:hypothetical protein